MRMVTGTLVLALFAKLICPALAEDDHALKTKDQEATSINPATNDSFPPWKATEGSPLWKLMHAKVKASFWTQGRLQSLPKPRSDSADLLKATNVAIITFGPTPNRLCTWWGKPYFLPDGANVIRDREIVEAEINRWNQYTVVESPARADLVVALREWDHDDCPGFCIENYGWTGTRLLVFKGGPEFEEKAEALWAKQVEFVRDNAYMHAVWLICDFRETVEKLSKRKGRPRSPSSNRCDEDAYRSALPYWELPEGNPLRDKMYQPSFSKLSPDAPSYRKVPAHGPELLNAKTVAIILFGPGHPLSSKYYRDSTEPNVLRERETVEKELKKSTHYKVIEDPRAADLVIAVRVWTEERKPLFFGSSDYDDMSRLAVFKGGVTFDQAPEILWADEGADVRWFCKDIHKLRNIDARK